MKPKMLHHVQPRERIPHRHAQVSEEIQTFYRAVASYPDRFAKEPGLTFRRHLSSLFSTSPSPRPRRH